MENNKLNKILLICNGVLFLGLIGIYILHFTDKGANSGKPAGTAVKQPVVVGGDSLTIAYVNTDTLMAKYQYAIELKEKIERVTEKQASLAKQEEEFQADYQNFLKTGDKLTLTQQQNKERELKERYEKLMQLEKQYVNTLPQEQKKLQDEWDNMTRAVYNFIRDYNAEHQKFNLILSRSFTVSPILYGDESMDITDEIVEGLNEEYKNLKKQ